MRGTRRKRSQHAANATRERRTASLFLDRCAGCHAVRGSDAAGVQAPDLTHLGSRRLIAAGALPNTASNLLDWIAHAQQIKPDALMPGIALTCGGCRRALRLSRDAAMTEHATSRRDADRMQPHFAARSAEVEPGSDEERKPARTMGNRPGWRGWLSTVDHKQHRHALSSSPRSCFCCGRHRGARDARAARAAQRDAAHARAVQPALHDARRDDDFPVRAAGAVAAFRTICGR